jgi:hypothetical protein
VTCAPVLTWQDKQSSIPPRWKRERNKSSPCKAYKKQKPDLFISPCEGSFITEGSEAECCEESYIYVPPPTSNEKVSSLSKDDLIELVTLIGKEFKKDLVKDIIAEKRNYKRGQIEKQYMNRNKITV